VKISFLSLDLFNWLRSKIFMWPSWGRWGNRPHPPVNPLLVGGDVVGVLAVVFACWSRHSAAMDWQGAHAKGRVAFWLSATGLSITGVVVLVLVLIVYTKDT